MDTCKVIEADFVKAPSYEKTLGEDAVIRRCGIHDAEFVRNIMTDPSIYPYNSDDNSVSPEDFDPSSFLKLEAVYFLSPGEDALFMVTPVNSVTYEVHSCVLPPARGKKAVVYAKYLIAWMFEHTTCRKLVTHVPSCNAPALALAVRAGMEREGVNRKSFLKNGILMDQTVLGICKKEVA